jgi:hypothetical protein
VIRLQLQHEVSERGHVTRGTRRVVDVPRRGLRYRATASTDISAPPDVVWDLYCDPHRYPEIAHATERMLHVPDGPMGVGYVYEEIGVLGPFKSEDQWTVTEFEPMRRQVHDTGDAAMRVRLEIDIEPTRSGCRVTMGLGVEPRGAMAVIAPVLWALLIRRLVQRAMEATVANAKAAAEAPRS